MSEGTLDEMMRDYAEAAVELARDFKIDLDYSEESLSGLDLILAQLAEKRTEMLAPGAASEKRQEATGQGAEGRTGQGATPEAAQGEVEEQMVMMCKLWGGYFGEVVRRRWGGEWAMETYPGAHFATLTLNVGGNKLFPSMKIYRCLGGEDKGGLSELYERVKGRIEKGGKQ